MVVVLSAGFRPTGGYRLEVQHIASAATTWEIHYAEVAPGTNCLVSQRPSTPTVLLSVPNQAVQILPVGTTVITDCELMNK